jgi:hypothetical protein
MAGHPVGDQRISRDRQADVVSKVKVRHPTAWALGIDIVLTEVGDGEGWRDGVMVLHVID